MKQSKRKSSHQLPLRGSEGAEQSNKIATLAYDTPVARQRKARKNLAVSMVGAD